MKEAKFQNFFDSPCLKLQNTPRNERINQYKHSEFAQDYQIMQTPARPLFNIFQSPCIGIFGSARSSESKQQIFKFIEHKNLQIRNKLDFSDEEAYDDRYKDTPKLESVHKSAQRTTVKKSLRQSTILCSYKKTLDKKEHYKLKNPEKGLRKLSGMAFQMISKLHTTSYKEVAIELIRRLNGQNYNLNPIIGKQNTKRRVYDVLNVLIATDIIKRNGSKISLKKQYRIQQEKQRQINEIQEQKEEQSMIEKQLQLLKKKINLKKLQIAWKIEIEKQTHKKYHAIKFLIDRNRHNQDPISTNIDFLKNLIKFPYIILLINPQVEINQINLKKKKFLKQKNKKKKFQVGKFSSKKVTFFYPESINNVVGDLDSILTLNNSLGQIIKKQKTPMEEEEEEQGQQDLIDLMIDAQ